MDKDLLKEALKNHRLNKIIFWNTFLVLTGGIIGITFKAIDSKGLFEITLVIIGALFWVSLIYLIGITNKEINKLWLLLKNTKD